MIPPSAKTKEAYGGHVIKIKKESQQNINITHLHTVSGVSGKLGKLSQYRNINMFWVFVFFTFEYMVTLGSHCIIT